MFLFIQLRCTCEGWHFAHTWKRSLRGLGHKTILDFFFFFFSKVSLTHAVQEGDRCQVICVIWGIDLVSVSMII